MLLDHVKHVMQVLAHTKAELQEAGVNITALDAAAEASGSAAALKSVARSATVLLVKNLPYSCLEQELHDLFDKFGVVRVVLPSTRALAIVELTDQQVRHSSIADTVHSGPADVCDRNRPQRCHTLLQFCRLAATCLRGSRPVKRIYVA
jgi:RNA recognition motif-containing protein